jgi:hypothetical protein
MYKDKSARVLNIKMGEKGKMEKKWGQGRGREEEKTEKGTEIKTDISRYETMLKGKGRTRAEIVKQQLWEATDTQEVWVLTPHTERKYLW